VDQDRRLLLAGWFFAVGSAIHVADHLRRGQGTVTDEVLIGGNLGLVVQVAVVTLIVTRHHTAPVAAVAAGFPLALGFLAVHWLPDWGALSDSFVEGGASGLSMAASLLEIAGALAVGLAGLSIVRRRGLASMA
jgi:hypothetical protein